MDIDRATGIGAQRSGTAGVGLLILAAALAANSLLGPLAAGVIRYRFSETLLRQGIGLDLVSLVVAAPLLAWAGILALRGRSGAPVLALGPAAYVAYMAIQYAIGPGYLELPGNNERFYVLHLFLFGLGLALAAWAWGAIAPERLGPSTRRAERRWSLVLLVIAALVVLRYLPGLVDLAAGGAGPPAFRQNPTSWLLIATMDLGIAVPATVAASVGLLRGAPRARAALHGVVAWFALVGLAVAAMAAVMLVRDDPAASAAGTAAFAAFAAGFLALAARLYRPILAGEAP
ncbi:MAG TPA: hypothetical protein VKB18_02425 [Gemmatimonadota bacterium]|nr:hypothetical protein [Gemmatimonadota bacterium]